MTSAADVDARRSRVRGALLGTMVGDALGVPFEGHDTTFEEYARARAPSGMPAVQAAIGLQAHLQTISRLTYSDDTQLMIALAEAMLEDPAVDPDRVAARFAASFDPARGYGAGALQVLRRIAAGEPWQQAARSVHSEGSFGNGAAMRVAPIGALYHDQPDQLHQAAERSAVVTHLHADGIGGAVVQAQAVSLVLTAGTLGVPLDCDYFFRALLSRVVTHGSGYSVLESVGRAYELARRGESIATVRRQLGNGVIAVEAVPAAIWAFLTAGGDVAQTLGLALALGGDTDTIAAMAGALVGAYHGEEKLPAAALRALADEPVGVEAVRALADRLLALKPTIRSDPDRVS